jgi:hypothetical protein
MQRPQSLLVLLAGLAAAGAYPIGATFQLLPCDESNGRQIYNLTSTADDWIEFRQRRSAACPGCDPDGNNCIDCMSCQVGAIPHLWYCPTAGGSQPNAAAWRVNAGANCTGKGQRVEGCPAGGLQLKTSQSNACFGAGDLIYGATVFLQKCNATDPRQLWQYSPAQGLLSSFGNRSFCLDGGTPLNISCDTAAVSTQPYCNTALTAEARAKDLVSHMLPSEKVQNMVSSNPGVRRLGIPPFAFSEALHGVASDCGASHHFTELGENNTGCPTSFPHALALGSTMNKSLWRMVGEVISTEARALNNQEAALGRTITGVALWTPDINLFRDPRCGSH